MRDKQEVMCGNIIRHGHEIFMLSRNEPWEDSDAGSCPRSGKECVRAVAFQPNRRRRKDRLKPLRLLEDLKR